jgi:hypothetical protein
VPVIVLAHLTETQQRAYRIADNQLALNASWDEEALRQELQGHHSTSTDLGEGAFHLGPPLFLRQWDMIDTHESGMDRR